MNWLYLAKNKMRQSSPGYSRVRVALVGKINHPWITLSLYHNLSIFEWNRYADGSLCSSKSLLASITHSSCASHSIKGYQLRTISSIYFSFFRDPTEPEAKEHFGTDNSISKIRYTVNTPLTTNSSVCFSEANKTSLTEQATYQVRKYPWTPGDFTGWT